MYICESSVSCVTDRETEACIVLECPGEIERGVEISGTSVSESSDATDSASKAGAVDGGS